MPKFTRVDYMNGKCSHQEYYAQFVTDGIKQRLASSIGLERIKASKDERFNDIPLEKWDRLPIPWGVVDKMKAAGDYLTLAGQVCIYKAAAREIRGK